MCPEQFERLLPWVGPFIAKSSKRRPTTTPDEGLIVTLRYLATGHAQFKIASSYRISPTAVGRIIRETTGVIFYVKMDRYMASSTGLETNCK